MYTLFRSPNYYYIYNANSNKIVKISKKAYINISNNEIDYNDAEIITLKKQGCFDRETVKILKHPETDSIMYQLDNNMTQLVLQVTQDCNLRCSYCPYSCASEAQRSHSDKKMAISIAKKAIDVFFKKSIGVKKPVISFYGGEPLLNLNLIRECVKYSKEIFWGKDLQFNMTSNGTLWTEDVMDFMIENSFQITLSIDGPQKIHDKHRKFRNGHGSFDRIIHYISKAEKKYGKELTSRMSVNMVMDPQNDFDEISKLFENEIFRKINVMGDIIDDDLNIEKNKYSESFTSKNAYHQFLAIINHFKIVSVSSVSPLSGKIPLIMEQEYESFLLNYDKLPESFTPSGPCIAGQRRLFVDTNGQLFPCEKISENTSFMNIGNLEDGIDYASISDIINISKITEDECKECWAFRLCDQCVRACDDGGSISKVKKLKNCEKTKNEAFSKLESTIFISELHKLYK
ncbi:radical SAM/SPASM domain-containing protein [Enterococcus sp. CSURQ0835]|uniref:radical SAM/SPASM domain-containing protein n=1 Tax=Enterococcus sp. CSURQ0835 TaxID=2681394 RepID=UPI001F3A91A5|nr:radical SAM protein [Enterococcus sp. CSURQ0835]